ncbi:flagellar basal-body MS-ring/collar protein FliF [Tepidibacter formicigenes]|jgi:flagellar M-ring protein FliF|uniref:Flagellar M-ring protein n=1 Tax=Tepidibacter formicigenes DSM 15518 TaxID=1123349 RepID=A0A1M6J8Y1_9FIRM|nr:flagellar basal-body MS-ring/collar protein FliF [Tepidibacter formicigenes]SHJ43110.1 flagellar M-ring protein FliF [Tepidibacter formicigenes DSM 15518]
MGDIFSKLKDFTNNFFSKYNKKQKISMAVGAFLIVSITTGSILYITRPEYVVLYKDLDLKESAQIAKNLDELKVDYKIKDEGIILVRKENINKIKMDLSTKGIPAAKFSYEDLLNKNTMFMSEDEKERAFNYALQNQIASVIEEIPSVKKALVNLSIPKTSSFILDENKQDSKASVFIELKEGAVLDKQSIDGIATLVSNSVEGLNSENVTIHDSTGRVLNSKDKNETFASSNQLELQNKVKEDIEENLIKLLSPVYGYGNVSVMASVKLNFDTDIMESKEYEPPIEGEENGIIRSLQQSNESVRDNQNGGVPGTDSNTEEITQYQQEENTQSAYDKSNKIVNYEMNEIVRKVERSKGQIQDITVAVILNSEVLEGKELSDDKKKEISNLVSSATGLDTKRVEVYAQSFNTDIADALNDASKDQGTILPMWMIILLIILVLIPILGFIIYIIIRNRKEKEKNQNVTKTEAESINNMEQEIEELELDIKESGYKKSIENLVNKNPEIVSQLLKSWLDEN